MNKDIKEKLDLNPDNMNEIAKEAYYQLENYVKNLQQENQRLKEIEKEHKKLNGDLRIEIKELKEKYMKLEDKYINNVSCCNEEDCDLFCEHKELKDRIDKAVEYATKEMRIVNDNEYHRLIEILKGGKK